MERHHHFWKMDLREKVPKKPESKKERKELQQKSGKMFELAQLLENPVRLDEKIKTLKSKQSQIAKEIQTRKLDRAEAEMEFARIEQSLQGLMEWQKVPESERKKESFEYLKKAKELRDRTME